MSQLRVPARVMPDVREAVFSVLHDALQDHEEPLTRPERERHPEWFVEGRADIEHAWALLDLIGWGDPDQEPDVELDLEEYGRTLLIAAQNHADLYPTWEEEADANDASRAERGAAPRKAEILRRGADLRDFIAHLEEVVPDPSP